MASLPLSYARLLLRLQEGETIALSEFKPKRLLDRMLEDQILARQRVGKNRSRIRLLAPEILPSYLFNQFSVSDLSSYIEVLDNPESEKSDFVKATANSKRRRQTTFKGIFLKSLFPIKVTLNGIDTEIETPIGSSLFIENVQSFVPQPSILIVGIENYENFRLIERQQAYVSGKNMLFIYRYDPATMREWLHKLPNSYLHFGDWDPAGICIYREEYRSILGPERCRLFVPENIEDLLTQYGSRSLYDQQYQQTKRLVSDEDPIVNHLIQLLHTQQKGLEQEILIS